MSWKRSKVSMPMSSAGILGMSSGEQLGGVLIDPKTFIIVVLATILLIKVLGYFI